MLDNEIHSNHTFMLYGVRGSDLHRWMDAPHIDLGPSLRKYRHNIEDLPFWAIDEYGLELARKIMNAHVELDSGPSSYKGVFPAYCARVWI